MPLTFHPVSQDITTSFISEAEMTPAIVPVPIKSNATGAIFERPYSMLSDVIFSERVAARVTIPPSGRAIIGSMTIPNSGLSEQCYRKEGTGDARQE